MKFIKLYLSHFGKFHNQEFILKDGINVVYGKNEAGKSTLHAFIKGMLFGIEKSRGRALKDNLYMKYQPFDTPGAYQGSMEFEHQGIYYRIDRSFYLKEKSCKLIRLDTGRQIPVTEGWAAGLIPNLTETNYKNTISIEQQQAKTNAALAEEVQNYIANMSTAKSNEVDVAGALEDLNTRKKKLDHRLNQDNLKTIEKEIKICIEKEMYLNELEIKKKELEEQIKCKKENYIINQNKQRVQKEKDLSSLYRIREKTEYFKNLSQRIERNKSKTRKFEEEIKRLKEAEDNLKPVRESLLKFDTLIAEKRNIQKQVEDYSNKIEKTNLKIQVNKNYFMFVAVVALVFLILLTVLFSYKFWHGSVNTYGGAVFFIIFIILIFGYLYMKQNGDKKEHSSLVNSYEEGERALEQYNQMLQEILDQYGADSIRELSDYYEELLKDKVKISYLLERQMEVQYERKLLSKQAEKYIRVFIDFLKRFEPQFSEKQIVNKDYIELADIFLYQWEILIKRVEQQLKEQKGGELNFEQIMGEDKQMLERIDWEMSLYEENDLKLTELREKQKELEKAENEAREDLEAINLAISIIKELSLEIHDSFGKKLNNMMSNFIKDITKGAYQKVNVDEKLKMKVSHNTRFLQVESLSIGTIDQMYLGLRLSVAEILFSTDNNALEDTTLPILFDDSYAFYDDERLEATLTMLSRLKRQVIIFTCQHREETILKDHGIKYHYLELV